MYYHEGTYYLYYLITGASPGEGFGSLPQRTVSIGRITVERFIESCLEDVLVQCYTLEHAPSGTILCENVDNIRLWQWKDG
jgi:hypothetical protein